MRTWPWLVQTFLFASAILIFIGINSLDAFQAIWAVSWVLYAFGLILKMLIFKNQSSGHKLYEIFKKCLYFVSSFTWGGIPALVVVYGYWMKQQYG